MNSNPFIVILILSIISWLCAVISAGFSFYLYNNQEKYTMNGTEKGYLLSACIAAVGATVFTTVLTLIVIVAISNKNKANPQVFSQEKLDESELNRY